MLRPIDNYFLQQEEPVKSCLLFLRGHITTGYADITEAWKYGMPFYLYKKRMFCYLWVHKIYKQPYIGFVKGREMDHPDLILEKRAKMKIFLLDPYMDIPVKKITLLLKMALRLYQ